MIEIVELKTKEQFLGLKRNDRLIVEWDDRRKERITMERIWGVNHIEEVIVRHRDNLYFSIDMFVKGESIAKKVFLVKEA